MFFTNSPELSPAFKRVFLSAFSAAVQHGEDLSGFESAVKNQKVWVPCNTHTLSNGLD